MAMEARLSLRLNQRLVMTPLLQQAIQLLQLSTLELQEVVEKELAENPLLEEAPAEGSESLDGQSEGPALDSTALGPAQPEQLAQDANPSDDLPFDLTSVLFDHQEERSLVEQEERNGLPFESLVRTSTTLAEHLAGQLHTATDDPRTMAIGETIIGNLDEDGYLHPDIGEIGQHLGATPEEVEQVLAVIQSFDPPGVAARTPQECLLIQLRADPQPDPVAVEIVERHFGDLERRRYHEIARALKVSEERVIEAVEEILTLEPKPGRKFSEAGAPYIVPDVFVHKMNDAYAVVLNEEGIPRLRVNSLYRSLLRGPETETRQYVEQKLRSALWLIKSVHQRQRTLFRVTESIVKHQREFFDRGLPFLRPLTLRDVAADIVMHESTVSRVTTNKYVQTPQGLFELKFFFHSGIASASGDSVSSVSVKKMIRDLLSREDQAKPLSDQEVAQVLKGQGLSIARRTVAKYREELRLLPSHQRRRIPKPR